jgi:membrane protein implicated in regulation of membrane protease activity
MDNFERLGNWINDMDAEWWPFLFLRPEKHAKISSLRVLTLAILYGVFGGMMMNAAIALAGQSDRINVVVLPLAAVAMFFVAFRFTLAWAWNRRADRERPSLSAWARAARGEDGDANEPAKPTDSEAE